MSQTSNCVNDQRHFAVNQSQVRPLHHPAFDFLAEISVSSFIYLDLRSLAALSRRLRLSDCVRVTSSPGAQNSKVCHPSKKALTADNDKVSGDC